MKTREELITLGLEGVKADEVMLLESKMMENAVKFSYTKKDGSLREAEGTLNPEKMILENGEKYEPKGTGKPYAPVWFRYFDLGVKDWRQFNVFNLVAVEG